MKTIKLPPTFEFVTDEQRFAMLQAELIHLRFLIQPEMRIVSLGEPEDGPDDPQLPDSQSEAPSATVSWELARENGAPRL